MKEKVSCQELLAVNLKIHRKAAGLTQEKLAEKAGISAQHIANIENRRNTVSLDMLDVLASALNVYAGELLLPPGIMVESVDNREIQLELYRAVQSFVEYTKAQVVIHDQKDEDEK